MSNFNEGPVVTTPKIYKSFILPCFLLSFSSFSYRLHYRRCRFFIPHKRFNVHRHSAGSTGSDIIGNKVFLNGFNKLTMLREMDKAMQKLNSIHLLRWVLVEGATLLLICFSIITANHFFHRLCCGQYCVLFYTSTKNFYVLTKDFKKSTALGP